jgi:hypothetical protein
VTVRAAKAAQGLAVSSASPSFGDQATTIDVHVLGSGFTAGAQATWLLHGTALPSQVHTNKTTVISSNELAANITIASDATLDLWDVQVALAGGKNGVGSELFEVTAAQILGSGTTGGDAYVYGMSEDLQVAGYAGGGGNAFVYADDAGIVNLGAGQAWTIDPLGALVAGRNASGAPTAWIRTATSTWVPQVLPHLPFSVGGNVQAAARAADGTLLVAGFDDSATLTKPSAPQFNRVVVWRRGADGSWSTPQKFNLPSGVQRGAAYGVNGNGQVVGQLDAGASGGAVWEDPVTLTRLAGVPLAINAVGSLVVGANERSTNQVPVYWWRNSTTGTWATTPTQLPSLAGPTCPRGVARAINSAGILVGSSCNATGRMQATVWRVDFSGSVPVLTAGPQGLPGLGPGSAARPLSNAISVTESEPFIIGGVALANGQTQLAVRWRLVLDR